MSLNTAILNNNILENMLPLQRKQDLNQFLSTHQLKGEISPLAKDMSNRQYFRLKDEAQSFVIMDAPPPESPLIFAKLSEYLLKNGLRTPKIIAIDEDMGFMLLEDFGDQTFTYILNNNLFSEQNLYETAIDILIQLQNVSKPSEIKPYSTEMLLKEVEVFIDWYWPFVKGGQVPHIIKNPFMEIWRQVFESMPKGPQAFVLRDYHVDNLMMIQEPLNVNNCGILDFQDAVYGSVMYDFVSLIEDARRDVSDKVIQKCWKNFLKLFPVELHDTLKKEGSILAAGRHVKVIGVFTRYAMKQKNFSKLCHLPRLWGYLENHFKSPHFKELKEWFDMYFPLEQEKNRLL